MIEGYERKVSQLREENVVLKSRHKELQEVFVQWRGMLEKVARYIGSQQVVKANGQGNDMANEQLTSKLNS